VKLDHIELRWLTFLPMGVEYVPLFFALYRVEKDLLELKDYQQSRWTRIWVSCLRSPHRKDIRSTG